VKGLSRAWLRDCIWVCLHALLHSHTHTTTHTHTHTHTHRHTQRDTPHSLLKVHFSSPVTCTGSTVFLETLLHTYHWYEKRFDPNSSLKLVNFTGFRKG